MTYAGAPSLLGVNELFTLRPHGLFLRREALGAGYRDVDLTRGVRTGTLVRVRHGAYVPARAWAVLDEVARFRVRGQAVLLTHGDRVMLSHTSAAAEHGLSLWDVDLSRVHVTRLDGESGRHTHDVVYHEGTSTPQDVLELRSGLVVAPVRAALEAASLHDVERGVVIVDSLYHRGLGDPDAVGRAYQRRSGHPFSRSLQVVVRVAREGAQSVGESRARMVFFVHGIPEPQLQYVVRDEDGEIIGICDLAWPQFGLLGEFDGVQKYVRMLRPGQTTTDAVLSEKVREDAIREITGCRMIRYTWEDLGRAERMAARTRRMLAAHGSR